MEGNEESCKASISGNEKSVSSQTYLKCSKHPTCPDPYPCLVCNETDMIVCNDCTQEQDLLCKIGVVSEDLGTMCAICLSKHSKTCPKHLCAAKSQCFRMECKTLVCDECYHEQSYSNYTNDVVYCTVCLRKHGDPKHLSCNFYNHCDKHIMKKRVEHTLTQ